MELIIYMDSWGRELDGPASGSYNKVYRTNDDYLQRIECYDNDVLTHTTIFVSTLAEAHVFLRQKPEVSFTECCLLTAVAGKYRQYDQFNLSQTGLIGHLSVQVYGEGIFPVYEKADPEAKETQEQIRKYFYLPEVKVDYEFEYHTDGSFKQLTIYDPCDYMGTEEHVIYPVEVGRDKNSFGFTWAGMEYYENAFPVLPDREIKPEFLPYQFRSK